MRVALVRRRGQLERRDGASPCSRVVRPQPGQTTAEAIDLHLLKCGYASRGAAPILAVVPLPARSVAEWLDQHAPGAP